jgi:hypothetical protein
VKLKTLGKVLAAPVTVPIKLVQKGAETMAWSLFRRVLIAAGGGLVAQGLLKGDELEAAVSALLTVATIGWSLWTRYRDSQKAAA